eukprot:2629744-Amphidinium_carterae.3
MRNGKHCRSMALEVKLKIEGTRRDRTSENTKEKLTQGDCSPFVSFPIPRTWTWKPAGLCTDRQGLRTPAHV